jgi:hypothetical protein
MKRGVWSPIKKNAYAENEKTIGGTKQMEFRKWIRGYEA